MKKIRMFLLIIAAMLVAQMYEPAAICEVQAATKTTAKKTTTRKTTTRKTTAKKTAAAETTTGTVAQNVISGGNADELQAKFLTPKKDEPDNNQPVGIRDELPVYLL